MKLADVYGTEITLNDSFVLTCTGAERWEARRPGNDLPVGYGATADSAILALTDTRIADEDDE